MYTKKTLKEIKSTLKESVNKQKEIEKMIQEEVNKRKDILNDYMNTNQFKSTLKQWVLKNKKIIIGIYLSNEYSSEMYYLNDEDILDILGYTIDIYNDMFPRDISIYLKDIENKQYYKYTLDELYSYYSDFVEDNKECFLNIPNINYSISMCHTVKEFTYKNYYQSYIASKKEVDFYKLFKEMDKFFEIILFDPDKFEEYDDEEFKDSEYADYEEYKDEFNPIESKWESEGYKLCCC